MYHRRSRFVLTLSPSWIMILDYCPAKSRHQPGMFQIESFAMLPFSKAFYRTSCSSDPRGTSEISHKIHMTFSSGDVSRSQTFLAKILRLVSIPGCWVSDFWQAYQKKALRFHRSHQLNIDLTWSVEIPRFMNSQTFINTSWWLSFNPSEKYAQSSNWIMKPQIGMKMINIWNHHLVNLQSFLLNHASNSSVSLPNHASKSLFSLRRLWNSKRRACFHKRFDQRPVACRERNCNSKLEMEVC